MIERDRERIREAVRLLLAAERPIRVLRSVSWDASVKEAFFALRARELPEVTYPVFQDGAIVREALAAARQIELPEGPIRDWLDRIAASIGTSAAMLEAVGTPEFFERSRTLYGEPTSELYGEVTTLELATAIESFADDVANIDLGAPAPACIPAHVVADRIRAAVQGRFGSEAPEVEVVQTLASNAIAGSRRIRLRDGTCFSDRDVIQLIEHEAFIHVCTFLNGKAQEDLPILGCAHAGTTKTQEGLAVLSEFMTAAMEPDRFRRLGDRVLAIQMAIEGADFLQVYRFFQTRVEDDQAYENTRRVFRGGVLTGGAPFTKDAVYLDGLLRVKNFFRIAVSEGRADCLLLLFCGKLDIEDLPALSHLAAAGLCRPPKYLPPWLEDRRFLVAEMTLSRFLNRFDLDKVRDHYEDLLDQTVR